MVHRDDLLLRSPLQPCETVFWHNLRLMHPRTAFDHPEGGRAA
jgi:alpha-ketoglutarate-dependent taurine dioxygenase